MGAGTPSKPTLTLVMAGDDSQVQKTFDQVGQGAQKMGDQVAGAGSKMSSASPKAGDLAEKTDRLATKSSLAYGAIGALGSGFALFGGNDMPKWLASAALGFDAMSGVMDIATLAQEGLNMAWLTSPITWIVLGIALIVGAFILLWTKCEGFRNFWKGLWEDVKSITGGVVDWFAALPGRIGGFFSGLGSAVKSGFASAINWVVDKTNGLIGGLNKGIDGLNWLTPGAWNDIPHIPTIPRMHSGGTVPGMPGQEVLTILQAGERVTPAGGGGGSTIVFNLTGSRYLDALLSDIAAALRSVGIAAVTR